MPEIHAHARLSALGPRPSLSRGFSLIELVLVMGIMGILAAIAAPRYASALANYRVDSAARRIIADLQVAQTRARTLSTSQTITFTPSSSQYVITGMADPDRPTSTYTVQLGEEPYRATLVSAKCGDDTVLVFNGYGVPDSGGQIVLRVGGVSRTITVEATTGNATVP